MRIACPQCILCANSDKLAKPWVTLANFCPMPWARHSLFFKWPIFCWQKSLVGIPRAIFAAGEHLWEYFVQIDSCAESEDLSFALQLCSIPGVGLQGKSFDFLSFGSPGLKWRKWKFTCYCKSTVRSIEEAVIYSCICSRAQGMPGLTLWAVSMQCCI